MIERPLLERWLEKVDKTKTCWLWTGHITKDGYGAIQRGPSHPLGRGSSLAHRIGYELLVGPIPIGLELDHICRIRHCVNPDHLEPVTRRINVLRGISPPAKRASRTHCLHGHEYTPENTGHWKRWPHTRRCLTCQRAAYRRWRDRRRTA